MAMSGQCVCSSSATVYSLATGEERADCAVAVRALTGNSGFVYIGNNGSDSLTTATGYELDGGDQIILDHVGDLSEIKAIGSADSQTVCWLKLASMS